MPTAYTYASELTQVGLGLESASAVGTAVAPTVQLVIDKAPDAADNITPIEDKGMRGTMAAVWDIVQGTGHTTIGLAGPVMCDTFPWLLANLLGDTVYQGTTAAPTTTSTSPVTAAQIAGGVSSLPVAASIPSGTLIQIDAGLSSEVRLTTGVSGAGPYTVTWSASQPLKVPHLTGVTVTAIVWPGRRASWSSDMRAVKPFIGKVEAAANVEPDGIRATESAGTTISEA